MDERSAKLEGLTKIISELKRAGPEADPDLVALHAGVLSQMGKALSPSPAATSGKHVVCGVPVVAWEMVTKDEVMVRVARKWRRFTFTDEGRAMSQPSSLLETGENEMKKYIGTKIVYMRPMTRGDYNAFRGLALPANEMPDDAGYLVEYTDGGVPNTKEYKGYVSWTPKAQADAAYRLADALPFGLAVEAMKKGLRVQRHSDPDLWYSLTDTGTLVAHSPHREYNFDAPVFTLAEVLADDWQVV